MNLCVHAATTLSKQEDIYFMSIEDITITGIQEGTH